MPGNDKRNLTLALTLLGMLSWGCGSLPDTHYYDIQISPVHEGRAAEEGGVGSGVWLDTVEVPTHLEGPGIFYRASSYEAGFYEYHRWIRPLSEGLTEGMMDYLKADGRFPVLAGQEDPVPPGAVMLRIKVLECNEVDFQEGKGSDHWIARLRLRATMIAPGGDPRKDLWIEEETRVKEQNACGVVRAIHEALERALPRVVDGLADFVLSL